MLYKENQLGRKADFKRDVFKFDILKSQRCQVDCYYFRWLSYTVVLIGESMEGRDVLDSRYLAKTKGQSISISITYILFLTKMQKGGSSKIDLLYL